MDPYVYAWSKAFGLTVFVEALTVLLLLRALLRPSPPEHGGGPAPAPPPFETPKTLALIGFANLASHPAVWFIIPSLRVTYPTMVLVAESWAVLSEAVFYALVIPRLGFSRALGVSLVANGLSFGLGLIIRAVTGWV